MQACGNEIRGAKTHLEDETKRFEEERSNHASEVSRLNAEIDDIRASFGSLVNVPERSRESLGSIASKLESVLEECIICSEPLLAGVGGPSFGLLSYSCACSQVRTLHVNCIVSMMNLACPHCSEDIVLIAPSLMTPTADRRFSVRKC